MLNYRWIWNFGKKNIFDYIKSGFGVRKRKRMQVIIDTDMKQNYYKELRQKESVIVIDYICVNGSSISPFIIFKSKNLFQSWLPKELLKG